MLMWQLKNYVQERNVAKKKNFFKLEIDKNKKGGGGKKM